MTQAPLQSLDPIADVLARIGRKGVKLWSINGQLRYRAAKDVLTEEEIEALRFYKHQIVPLLERASSDDLIVTHAHPGYAVLSFSQEAHWRRHKLYGRPAFRDIASAVRIASAIDIDLFRACIVEVTRRHVALRTRIVVRHGVPLQKICESVEMDFDFQNLMALPPCGREVEVKRSISNLIRQPIEVSKGPLWGVRLLRIGDEEFVLVAVMEHIISDMRSLQILLRDIFSTYEQASRGCEIRLPDIAVQFSEYAQWQRSALASRGESSYWTTRLSECPRVRFQGDLESSLDSPQGWDYVPLRLTLLQKESLSRWARLRQTTPSLAAFTAYTALVLRWCNALDTVIHYTVDGRTRDKVQNTIGYFAKQLPIRVGICCNDSFMSLLKRITAEYCQAYEHSDCYHLHAQIPAPMFSANTYFNWITQEGNNRISDKSVDDESVKWLPVPFKHPMPGNVEIDAEPFILLFDQNTEISGGVYFPKNRFSFARMQRFASNFNLFIEALLESSDRPIYDVDML